MSKQPEIVECYKNNIAQALAINADIVVSTGTGPAYVRAVERTPEQKKAARTLMIGPVSLAEMEQLRAYIRSILHDMNISINSKVIEGDELKQLLSKK
jgi:hypothetical protein